MIGTGIFTSLGYQLVFPFGGFEVALLWIVGGILAIFGSLCYGSLSAHIPKSGGEVQFLSNIYGKPFGFSSGLISIVAGFSAPIAASAFALASYVSQVLRPLAADSENFAFIANPWFPKALAIFTLFSITILHHQNTRLIQKWQNFFVLLKLTVIVALIGIGSLFIYRSIGSSPTSLKELIPSLSRSPLWFGSGFALCLVYVAQAYSGWNAAVYIAEEIENPVKNLPRALLIGTSIVVFLSIAINLVFYFGVPRDLIIGQKEVAFFAAKQWLGKSGGDIVAICISIGLISAISSMVWTGGRVLAVLGHQFSWFFSAFRVENKHGRPCSALWFLFAISTTLIASSSFQFIIELVGFSLTLCSALAVAGLFILKKRKNEIASHNFRDPFYPVSAIVYVSFCAFILCSAAFASPSSFCASIGLFFAGLILGKIHEIKAKQGESTEAETSIFDGVNTQKLDPALRGIIQPNDRIRTLVPRNQKSGKAVTIGRI